MAKHISWKIWTSGLVGYRKLTCLKSMFPFTFPNIIPESSLGSILDLRSSIAKIEAAANLALLESAATELDSEIPMAARASAKKTYREHKRYWLLFCYRLANIRSLAYIEKWNFMK